MSNSSSSSFRVLARLVAVAGLSLFIAAPTPGNIGGCSGTAGSQPITGDTATHKTAEYEYFDRGLCSYFCERLRECGATCSVLAHPPENCDSNSPAAFQQCVRGEFKPQFTAGVTACPHDCSGGQTGTSGLFQGAYQWDVEACGDALLARSCEPSGLNASGHPDNPGSIGAALKALPRECLNVCQQ
jgi:hypothetical protein